VLTGHVHRGSARGDHVHPRAPAEDLGDHAGGGGEDVLAVVEDEDRLERCQQFDDRLAERTSWPALDAESGSDGGGHRVGVGDRRQLHQPHPVAPADQGPGQLEGQPGLPDTARTGQRDEAHGRDRCRELPELVIATDQGSGGERRRRLGQGRVGGDVADRSGTTDAAQRQVIHGDGLLEPDQLC
jgi:hypothetical protein